MSYRDQQKEECTLTEESESNKLWNEETCDVCHGSGSNGDGTCSSCNGTGII